MSIAKQIPQDIQIRMATLQDAPTLLAIYAPYVTDTAISFEYAVPSLTEFQNRMHTIMEKYPYLVIEQEEEILGYAYAGVFIGRTAYDWSCEVTIYLKSTAQKCGLGRMLYEALEHRLHAMGVTNLYACIAYPRGNDPYVSRNSAEFHAHLGFITVGTFHQCGYKFGRWYDMIWMEKYIGTHQTPQSPVQFLMTP